jgi:hypothetical protein
MRREINYWELQQELENLLDPDSSEYELHVKLEIGRKFMLYCSESIDPDNMLITDEEGFLTRFEEVFFAIQSIVEIFSSELYQRILEIESKLNLSQNIVRLGMLERDLNQIPNLGSFLKKFLLRYFRKIKLYMPEDGYITISPQLLLEIKTALTRLAGMCGASSREAKKWWMSNKDVLFIEDFYDPRRISKNYLAELIVKIKDVLEEDPDDPNDVLIRIHYELNFIYKELEKNKTSWNKVISKLSQIVLMLAALVTISAKLDKAYESSVNAFNYISEQSILRPSVPRKNVKEKINAEEPKDSND